jgi:hypothetical protein
MELSLDIVFIGIIIGIATIISIIIYRLFQMYLQYQIFKSTI